MMDHARPLTSRVSAVLSRRLNALSSVGGDDRFRRSLCAAMFLAGLASESQAQDTRAQVAEYTRLIQSANAHQRAKRWAAAVAAFDSAFVLNTGNYTLYSATQAACQLNDTTKALHYFRQAAPRLLPNVENWPMFAADTLSRCVHASTVWREFTDSMRLGYDATERRAAAHLADIKAPERRLDPSVSATQHDAAARALVNLPFKEAATRLRALSPFLTPPVLGHWALLNIRVPDDTTVVPYLVHVPASYDAKKATPLLVYLHEAVSRPIFAIGLEIDRVDELMVRAAHAKGWLVLWPLANRQLNWVEHTKALRAVEQEIDVVRRQYNVDETRIWIGGNSDGGRGALWFATRNPNLSAATFHLATLPILALPGGTLVENLRGASRMFAVSGAEDALFTPAMVDPLWARFVAALAPLRRVVIDGADHGVAGTWANIAWVYDSLAATRRVMAPRTVQWSTTDVREGRRAWVSLTAIDTLAQRADWHGQWVDSVGASASSAAVEASIQGNTVRVRTSRVTRLRLAPPASLIDYDKPVRLVVNGRQIFRRRLRPSSRVMVEEFLRTLDRSSPVGTVFEVDVSRSVARAIT
ncbi:MAG: hypothetical protein IT353_10325 [Gemmatimonadaceae bacterium]|nr:hypothetical protein [Gemmatimonadaceae bacterium]